MRKFAKPLQRLAQSSDPVTSLRARQLLARFRRVARPLILTRLEDYFRAFVKIPGTIGAMGFPEVGGASVEDLIKQIHPRVKKVYDLFAKSQDALELAGRYDGGHQPERAVNLRKGAERLKKLAIEALKDVVPDLAWVHSLESSVPEGSPAFRWVFVASNRVKALESALRNQDSVM